MPWAAVNAESENTRNSEGNGIRMTDSGQSRKEAAVTTTGAVNAKTTTLIGFWNVRTMYMRRRWRWIGRVTRQEASIKLYHSCVLTTLLYGSECWRLTEKDLTKLSTFHTKRLRRILRIFWPNVISNKDLFERCGTEPMAAKTAMHWTPEGKRKRGRPKITWRRTIEKEIKEMGKTWGGHQVHGKGPPDVEGARCCPTCHLGVKGMSE